MRTALLTASLLAGVAGPISASGADDSEPANPRLGERLYLEGVLPSGAPLEATVLGDVPLRGGEAACVNCHRRSALGSTEADRVALPITTDFLYRPRETRWRGSRRSSVHPPPKRPAYDTNSLLKVLNEGTDPSGRTLDALMPRFDLDRAALKHLLGYLEIISDRPDPGVTPNRLHLATIVASDADPGERDAMMDVLETFIDDRTSHTRHELRRAKTPPWNKEWEYTAYRDLALHVWELQGPPSEWSAQLDTYYRRQPVFAVVSGTGNATWRPIHDFCERRQVPCLLPNINHPPGTPKGHFSFYFSRGLGLEAQALARHLIEENEDGPILQVFRPGTPGARAAAAFRRAMAGRKQEIHDQPLLRPPTKEQWSELRSRYQPSRLIVWLQARKLAGLGPASEALPADRCRIFMSSSLIKPQSLGQPLRRRGCLIHRYSLPDEFSVRRRRVEVWLRSRGVEPAPGRIQANTFFAVTLTVHALTRIRNLFSREYFLEKFEHIIDNAIPSHAFPRLTLGAGQRYASKGARITRLHGEPPELQPVSRWIIPAQSPPDR